MRNDWGARSRPCDQGQVLVQWAIRRSEKQHVSEDFHSFLDWRIVTKVGEYGINYIYQLHGV